ncbi:mannan endo-1,4-beta-mannosidase 4-like [Coffea arabica]|uniref:mannan endo-1,4-beta-mannosidase n=1 Tax=Coffea arabica TaxID=13443 RepID=A0A6P6W6H0_COFAR|nr:mannan endo-1,4-beta-mannosidase 4-like [Coffea arabica]
MMSKEKSLLLRCCSLSLALFILLGVGEGHGEIASNSTSSSSSSFNFVKTRGTEFVMNGRPLYLNGFNAYWLMYMASDPSTRTKVSITFQQASKYGMNAARTWAFSDGGYRALQQSPGSYNEDMFKGLDFVVSEAKKYGIHLILTLVNNWEGYGGKKQYVQWARDQGHYLNNDDDFFTDPIVRGYFKNHIKTVLTRINSITGLAYKDDPTIFAWELMNEPRCQSDLSGKAIQDWISEMATHVKSIDSDHLLDIGLEGFYGESVPQKKEYNPGYQVGTDFISNNRIVQVDFATIHLYPDQWVPNSNDETQAQFVDRWIKEHIDDSKYLLEKPLLLTEFGKSSRSPGYQVAKRDAYLSHVYDTIYACAATRGGGVCGGNLFWQVMAQGMESWGDGYEIVLEENPSTVEVIAQQSNRLSSLT